MSKQNKLRSKQKARKAAKGQHKGPSGASGYPHRQSAPPWVKGGSRKPKKAFELEAKLRAERDAAAREATNKATREAVYDS